MQPSLAFLAIAFLAGTSALPPFTTTPPPEAASNPLPNRFMPHRHRFHRAHEDNAISKADLVMAVTDKFGTIMDNFAEKIASDFDDVFKHAAQFPLDPHLPLEQDRLPDPLPDFTTPLAAPETTPELVWHDDRIWTADSPDLTPHP